MKRFVAATLISGMLVTPAMAQNAMVINHPGVACVAASSYTKIAAQVPGADSARLHFRASGRDAEYFVEMLRDDAGNWWAVLPIPEQGVESVTYWISARNGSGAEATLPAVTAPVTGDCGVPSMTEAERQLAQSLAVGVPPATPNEVRGFRCDSVDFRILPDGRTERHVCDAAGVPVLAGAGAAPAALTAAEKAVIIGGALATAGAAVVAYNNNEDDDEVSPVRP